MRAAILIAVLSSGCDILFQLGDIKQSGPDAACGNPDEDGDCFGDVDDNCPGISNPSQANDLEGASPDSVGDVCDPQQTRAVDMRLAFFGFNDPSSDAITWPSPDATNWTLAQGYAEHVDAVDNGAILMHAELQNRDDFSVEAGFTFGAWDPNLSQLNTRLGVWIDLFDPAGRAGHACVFNKYNSGATDDTVYLQERFNLNGNIRMETIPELQPGDDLVISMRKQRNPDILHCHAIVNGIRYDVPDVTPMAGAVWPDGGHIAVQAGHTSAQLRYVVTYVGL